MIDFKKVGRLAIVAMFGVAFLGGCGSDSNPDTSVDPVINVKDGIWVITTTTTQTGPSKECTLKTTVVDTTLQCFFDVTDTGVSTLSPDCDFTDDGSSITFDCSGSIEFPPCRVNFSATGTGTYTETSLVTTTNVQTTVSGGSACEETYAQFNSPCITIVQISGQWISDFTDSTETCDDSSISKGEGLRNLSLRTAFGAITGP